MEAIYPYAHIIHLILAIMFLGYVFTDLAVISALKNKFDYVLMLDVLEHIDDDVLGIGILWNKVSRHIFKAPNCDGKTMGLASYGKIIPVIASETCVAGIQLSLLTMLLA